MGGALGFLDKHKPVQKVLANSSILAGTRGTFIDIFFAEPAGKPWFAVTTETQGKSILLTASFRLKQSVCLLPLNGAFSSDK